MSCIGICSKFQQFQGSWVAPCDAGEGGRVICDCWCTVLVISTNHQGSKTCAYKYVHHYSSTSPVLGGPDTPKCRVGAIPSVLTDSRISHGERYFVQRHFSQAGGLDCSLAYLGSLKNHLVLLHSMGRQEITWNDAILPQFESFKLCQRLSCFSFSLFGRLGFESPSNVTSLNQVYPSHTKDLDCNDPQSSPISILAYWIYETHCSCHLL